MTSGKLLTCARCGETGGYPLVHDETPDGKPRCDNTHACARRVRKRNAVAKANAVQWKKEQMERRTTKPK